MRTLPGAKRAPFPAFIEPMHPTQHSKPPVGAKWQYEIKLDGWRGHLHLQRGAAKLFSRNGNDLTENCATIATAAAGISRNSAHDTLCGCRDRSFSTHSGCTPCVRYSTGGNNNCGHQRPSL
jgi:hypothetical protein